MKPPPKLIALVGGSGAGKTWLSHELQKALALPVTQLSLDDFYHDQSHLAPAARANLNFDHPEAIDWRLAEEALRNFRAGRVGRIPRYSFVTHSRLPTFKLLTPKPVILVDGLWLLWRPDFRKLFHVSIFLHCPARLRLERRLCRDVSARGRDAHSVRRQFRETVAPMHKQFVEPQARWADVVLRKPPGEEEIVLLANVIKTAGRRRALQQIPTQGG